MSLIRVSTDDTFPAREFDVEMPQETAEEALDWLCSGLIPGVWLKTTRGQRIQVTHIIRAFDPA